ncbi:unnamed protein product [Nippostrongylus brasiliensis]|uniref:Sulfhydryl oxidase n=1 Tax=Nippostrongylus brasiliensis TaxID=27835 RepID=A0A0N4XC74_NIPBR|nr:unnamed protein product [Nippostrongylus brasiliensis]
MVLEETMRLKRRLNHRMQEMFSAQPYSREALGLTKYMAQLDATATPPPCPAPNRTMFTTAAPPTEATIPLNLCTQGTTPPLLQSLLVDLRQLPRLPEHLRYPPPRPRYPPLRQPPQSTSSSKASAASSNPTSSSKASAASSTHSTSSTPSTTASPSTVAPTHCVPAGQQATKKSFQVPYVYHYDTDQDPFYNWMSSIYGYMFKSEEICDQAHITDLNSITEDQFNGFFATLAAVHPGPFCSLCEHFMTELHERVFTMHPMWEEDERHLMRLLYANIPSTKAFCSAVAPACYEEYEAQCNCLFIYLFIYLYKY